MEPPGIGPVCLNGRECGDDFVSQACIQGRDSACSDLRACPGIGGRDGTIVPRNNHHQPQHSPADGRADDVGF